MSEVSADRPGAGVPGFDDVTDQQLRERADLNWAMAPDDVLPAWVAEMDYAPNPVVAHAVQEAVRVGRFGYPSPEATGRLRSATAEFAAAHYGWQLDPALVIATGDVMAGVLLAVETLCDRAPGRGADAGLPAVPRGHPAHRS